MTCRHFKMICNGAILCGKITLGHKIQSYIEKYNDAKYMQTHCVDLTIRKCGISQIKIL